MPSLMTAQGAWFRSQPNAGLRRIADGDGNEVAFCPSYNGGPSLEEAQDNAELIACDRDPGGATPGPWTARQHQDGTWLVLGPCDQIVAQAARNHLGEQIARRIVAKRERVSPPQTAVA